MARNPETALMNAMIGLLRLRGVRCDRRNVAGVRPFVGKGGRVYRVRLGRAGESDITGILPDGRRIEVEAKVPGNRPTPEQFEFLRSIEASNGVAFWTDSLDHLDMILSHVLRGARTRIAPDGGIDLEYPS